VRVGGREAPAAYGRWALTDVASTGGGGTWLWSMVIGDQKLYLIKLTTNAGNDREKEARLMEGLEEVVAGFRTVSR
ncbi:MAG: hypothetical protein JXB45_08680, partial [Candidatus Krumholzibacteriota bacterium]|nr:hypothetical protein [Candidatus Krumholzibacteriota bacterium]